MVNQEGGNFEGGHDIQSASLHLYFVTTVQFHPLYLAAGEAERVQVLGAAEADRSARVGIAQALATEEQVRAYGGPRLQLTHQVMTRFAEAIQATHIDIVPRILMTGSQTGDGRTGGNAFEALLATLLSDRIGDATGTSAPSDPAFAAYRSRMRDSVVAGLQVEAKGS